MSSRQTMSIPDHIDLEATPDGGVVVVTRRMALTTDTDCMLTPCRTIEELRRAQGEDRWRKKVVISDATIRQRIF